ncbi:hypothetical protein TWF696_009767 [Orbilia brochopaga]|uniref:DUF7357 domain-containing protein n=1 Tax=Orbilia brochopaga TaxID=3140254 RepID=A0AAV9UC87_9PEZI
MRRVRLVIHRPDVPQVRILWPLGSKISGNPRYSVYDLLTDVSNVIPLDDWNLGLEDYVAEFAGCELLHFMPIKELISDNDELTIRPLTRTEAKEFLKGGRRQISTTGRKLQDGVPIGRNFVTPAPDRPRIEGAEPPSKRRRTRRNEEAEDEESDGIDSWGPVVGDNIQETIERQLPRTVSVRKRVRFEEEVEQEEEEEGEDNRDEEPSSSLILANFDDDDDDDESDGDFCPDNSEDEDQDTSSDEEEDEDEEEEAEKGGRKAEEPPTTVQKPDTLPKDAQTASLKGPHDKNTKPSDSDSESSSSDDSFESDSSEDESAESSDPEDSSSVSSPTSTTSDSDSDSSSESDESESESESEPEEVSSKVDKMTVKPQPQPPAVKNIPFEGTSTTKSRNQRRRESKALAKLIKNQVLPVGSTKEDMRKWREQNQNLEVSEDTTTASGANLKITRKDSETSGTELSDKIDGSQQGSDSTSEKASPMYIPMEPLEVTVEQMDISIDVPATSSSQPEQPVQSDEVSSSPVGNRRHRPVASDAAKRLILGSLGLRKPRNQAEGEKLRADWKKANSKYAGHKSKGFLDSMAGKEGTHSRYDEDGESTTEVPKEDKATEKSDPDAWKKKIRVFAVECNPDWYDEDGGDQLPTPPFPFDQRQLLKGAREWSGSSSNKNKKKKNKNRNQQDDAAQEENGDGSYYDDSSMQVDSAQRSAPVERSTQGGDAESGDEDLPPVPTDLSKYPKLQKPVLPESIVVFSRMVLENYTPTYKQATARVLSVQNGSHIRFQLAKRDRPKAVYNWQGERIFGGFHMPGMENDETENGIEELDMELMLEARVIKEGVPLATDSEVSAEEDHSERVPETIRSGESLEQDDNGVQHGPQAEDEDLPMLDPVEEEEDELSRQSGVVQQSSFQSSSFVEPPFQTNGSCGYGHTDSENDTDPEPEGGDSQDIAEDSAPSHHQPMRTTSDMTQEGDLDESSAEAHRFDDVLTQEHDVHDGRPPTTSSQLDETIFQTALESHSSPRSEASIQVRGTPDPVLLSSPSVASNAGIDNNWDLSVDISGLEPAEVDKIKKMVKIKEECPEDTELLREALKPFHHPSEATSDDGHITVDISPPASPKVKRERLSTEEALVSSPVAALQDITERSTNNNAVDLDVHDDDDGSAAVDDDDHLDTTTATTTGPGPGMLATTKNRCIVS